MTEELDIEPLHIEHNFEHNFEHDFETIEKCEYTDDFIIITETDIVDSLSKIICDQYYNSQKKELPTFRTLWKYGILIYNVCGWMIWCYSAYNNPSSLIFFVYDNFKYIR